MDGVSRGRAPQWTDGQAFDFVIEDPKLQESKSSVRTDVGDRSLTEPTR